MHVRSIFYPVVFIVSFCSIVYELVFAQALSVAFGNTVVQYSLTIGIYMSALGLGSLFFAKFKSKIKNEYEFFVFLELFLSFVAVFGIFFIFYLSSWVGFGNSFLMLVLQVLAFLPVLFVGFLSGIELPLLVHINKGKVFAQALGVDYFGSLAGTLVFALILYPHLGLVSTIFIVAFLNVLAALFVGLFKMNKKELALTFVPVFLAFFVAFYFNQSFTQKLEKWFMSKIIANIYAAYVMMPLEVNVYKLKNTKYQTISEYKIKFNEYDEDLCFNLDRHIQGCGNWVDSYHYGAVYVPMSLFDKNKKLDVLILGGGDFIAVNYFKDFDERINGIDLVDLDKEFQDYAKSSPLILSWNKQAFRYPKLTVYIDDALDFLRKNAKSSNPKKYDLILIDLPGLKHSKLLPLYSVEFYKLVKDALKQNGVAVSWVYPEMSRFSKFNDILSTTLYKAGFKRRLTYSALQPDYTTPTETESFMVLSNTNTNTIRPTNFYTKKFKNYYTQSSWEYIKPTTARENSVFAPNLSMLIKDYDE